MRVLFGYDKGISCATITSSKEKTIINSGIQREVESSKNTKTSRIITPGLVKMTAKWSTQNQLKTHLLQESTIKELL